jgi:mannan endo-1,4-beta-mannosidase
MFKRKISSILILSFLGLQLLLSCKKDEIPTPNNPNQEYSTLGSKILFKTNPIQVIGANAFHTFGGTSNDMNSWNIDIVREFIGNVKENPLTGSPIQDSNTAYLYSLQSIVDSNRSNHKITILCAFGWDGTNTNLFTGKSPAQTFWLNDFKIKLKQWAIQFKDQPDVWLEVWNEPYRYDRADGYTDAIWMNDMNELVALIRNNGNNNIILVPCAEQGQDESVLLHKGASFLANKTNIVFDIHAYENWLLDNTNSISNRLELMKQQNLPILFGETAPMNAGVLMNPQPFLDLIYNRGLSVCAWVWKQDENDTDALLTSAGLPNNKNNNNWGTTFKNLSLKARNP